jgi:hypothetical protein
MINNCLNTFSRAVPAVLTTFTENVQVSVNVGTQTQRNKIILVAGIALGFIVLAFTAIYCLYRYSLKELEPELEGFHEKILPHGTILLGKFKKGELVQGKKTTPTGDIHEGKFKKSKIVKGMITDKIGISVGEFEADKLEGYGKKTLHKEFINKATKKEVLHEVFLEGLFKNDNLVKGKKIDPDGNIFEGEFKNGYLIKGKKTDIKGIIYEGEFSLGKLVSGKKTFLDDGEVHEGEFKGDILQKGKKIFPDGTEQKVPMN